MSSTRWAFPPEPLAEPDVTVEVDGTPALASLLQLAEEIALHVSLGRTVWVDLDGLVLTSPGAMRRFLGHLHRRCPTGGVRLVCSRPTGRELLRRWGAASLPVVDGHASSAASPRVHPWAAGGRSGRVGRATQPT